MLIFVLLNDMRSDSPCHNVMSRAKHLLLHCNLVQGALDLKGLDFAMDLLERHFAIDGNLERLF